MKSSTLFHPGPKSGLARMTGGPVVETTSAYGRLTWCHSGYWPPSLDQHIPGVGHCALTMEQWREQNGSPACST